MDKHTQNQKWPINTWQTPTLDRKVCRGPVNCSVTWLMKSSHVLFSCWSTSRLESMNSSVTWGVPCQHKTLAAHLLGCNQPAMVAFLEVWATKISASIETVLKLMNLYEFFWPWQPWPWSSWPHFGLPQRSRSFFMAAKAIKKSVTDVLMLDSAAVYSLWLSLCPSRFDLCWTLNQLVHYYT